MRRMAKWMTALAGVLLLPAVAMAQAQGGDLAARVAKLEQTLGNRGLLDLLTRVENLQREVQTLRGQLETQGYELEQLRKSQAATYTDLDRRLQGLVGGAAAQVPGVAPPPLPMLAPAPGDAVAGTPAPQSALQVETEAGLPPPVEPTGVDGLPPALPDAQIPPAPGAATDAGFQPALPGDGTAALGAVAPAAGALTPPPTDALAQPTGGGIAPALAPAPLAGVQVPAGVTNPGEAAPPLAQAPTLDDAASEAAYRDAFGLLRAGDYDRAIAAFNDFQQRYPQSQYGDNAQYWLAEAHYAKRDYAAAVPEYQKMLTAYPQSRKLSHAMLKMGYGYDALGQPEQARAVLEALRQQFPGSAAARLAEERLAQLGGAAPAP